MREGGGSACKGLWLEAIWTRKKVSPPPKYRQCLVMHYKNTTRRGAMYETYTLSRVLYEEIMESTTYGVSTEACRVRPVGMMHANHPTQSKSA